MFEEKMYGVIAEWKEEGPLVMEGHLMTYEAAHNRMKALSAQTNVIRVAMFKALHAYGNDTLIPQEAQP